MNETENSSAAWHPIETAPRDGTVVLAGKMSESPALAGLVQYPVMSRLIDGRWCCEFDGDWRPYDPQPTHWHPSPHNSAITRI